MLESGRVSQEVAEFLYDTFGTPVLSAYAIVLSFQTFRFPAE